MKGGNAAIVTHKELQFYENLQFFNANLRSFEHF